MTHHLNRRKPSRIVLRLVAAASCAWAIATASAQATLVRSLLTAPQVVAAMHDSHLPTDGVEVRLAAAITSAVAEPSLEIKSVVPITARQVRLSVACRNVAECLPFFALATYADAVNPAMFALASQHQTVKPATRANLSTSTTVRSGSPATLDFDEERLHVRVDVICLESGASGDRIRVTTRDRKQVYQAEVVSAGILKGTLTR